jgi:hypothetical protein
VHIAANTLYLFFVRISTRRGIKADGFQILRKRRWQVERKQGKKGIRDNRTSKPTAKQSGSGKGKPK